MRPTSSSRVSASTSGCDDEQPDSQLDSAGVSRIVCKLVDFSAELEIGGEGPREIDAFISVHGPLLLDGAPVALAAIPARDRVFAELTTPEMIDRVRAALHPDMSLPEFIQHHVKHGGVPLPPDLLG